MAETGPSKGMSRYGERGGGADRREHVGVVLHVGGEDRDDDLDVVAEALGEERAQGAVRHAAGEDGVRGGTAFAAQEAAGDLADGVHALFEVDRQREEIDVRARLGVHAGRHEDDGFADGDGD